MFPRVTSVFETLTRGPSSILSASRERTVRRLCLVQPVRTRSCRICVFLRDRRSTVARRSTARQSDPIRSGPARLDLSVSPAARTRTHAAAPPTSESESQRRDNRPCRQAAGADARPRRQPRLTETAASAHHLSASSWPFLHA